MAPLTARIPAPRPGDGSRTVMLGPMSTSTPHDPVLLDRIVALLAVGDTGPGVLVDATVGAGGHAAALLTASAPDIALVGFDRDADALALAARRLEPFGDRVVLVHDRFDTLTTHLPPLLAQRGPLLGVLYDLGVSSMQLDRGERGFSFRSDAPLDMRMDATGPTSAADLVNTLELGALARILSEYGEERFARRIAGAIVAARPIARTLELAEIVTAAIPAATRRPGPRAGAHPATRTFQALRIAVNAELDAFRASLPQALELARRVDSVVPPNASFGWRAPPAATPGFPPVAPRGGRVAVLSYHSLEDRIAKQTFATAALGCICPPELPVCGCGRTPLARHLTRGAETPGPGEVAGNPRARSAKLRAVEVLAAPQGAPAPGRQRSA